MASVEIRPPSARGETLAVLRFAMAVLVAAYVFRPSLGGSATADRDMALELLPYQRLIRDASAIEQRMFREIREGLLEAERIRAETGSWPAVVTLVNEGIPPFAPDPTRNPSYSWTSVRQDWAINYLGVPEAADAPAWLLVILEPEPGMPADQAPEDETHHRLPDGTMLHVSTWSIPESKRRSGFSALRLPQNEGWTNWLMGSNAE
jgi:hypothetical protein